MANVTLRNVRKTYAGGFEAIKGINFDVGDGQFCVHHKIPQVGTVRIEDDVEIGAGSTIDRAALSETVIGEGTKIDNLVQIAHNVKVGKRCLLVAQGGIAGSTELGDDVQVGGQSGFSGHLKIGKGVHVYSKSAVFTDVKDGVHVRGIPAVPLREYVRQQRDKKK